MQKIATIEEAWGRKYPEQMVLAITTNAEDRVNLIAIGWLDICPVLPLRMVSCIFEGISDDAARMPEFYDGTYEYTNRYSGT